MAPPISEYEAYEQGTHLLQKKYRFVLHIQKGSFGRVTLAVDVTTQAKVALKAMFKTKNVAPMARHEIRMLQRLGRGCEHICLLVDHFETADFIILALEYCENGDLYDAIHSEASYNPRAVDVWNITQEMVLGIRYAHSLGVYHRDIKPENILFTDKGRVKICDWGLATDERHAVDFNVGTEKYMAPECFVNMPSKAADSYDCMYADYWSLGITLLTATFGTSPFKPIRKRDGNVVGGSLGDAFKRKRQEAAKSLESDSNFRNFALYNKPEVLYDIYPTMNENCFRIFMNLLRIGGLEDDIDSYKDKIQQRNLDKFMEEFASNWKYGLTVWEEDELWVSEDSPELQHDLFDMEGFDPDSTATERSQTEEETRTGTTGGGSVNGNHAATQNVVMIPPAPRVVSAGQSAPLPSLEESIQPQSWCDYGDEELDDEKFNAIFSSMSFNQPLSLHGKHTGSQPQIANREGGFSWSDY